MKTLSFWFDPISPFAYLAFERLPQALQGLSYTVRYRPVLFAALLKRHGQLGPAEIAGKRAWTYRHVLWLARTHGVPFDLPAAHPFNPLPLLRLAVACSDAGEPNRWVCEQVFHHVWRAGGADAADPQRLAELAARLQSQRKLGDEAARERLRANTAEALARGVFGLPTCELDGRLFWGFDALPMLRQQLAGEAPLPDALWDAAERWPVGAQRTSAAPQS